MEIQEIIKEETQALQAEHEEQFRKTVREKLKYIAKLTADRNAIDKQIQVAKKEIGELKLEIPSYE